jgi:hypothetical protein
MVLVKLSKRKEAYMYMSSILNGFRDRAISLSTSNTVDKKEMLHTVSNTGFYS